MRRTKRWVGVLPLFVATKIASGAISSGLLRTNIEVRHERVTALGFDVEIYAQHTKTTLEAKVQLRTIFCWWPKNFGKKI